MMLKCATASDIRASMHWQTVSRRFSDLSLQLKMEEDTDINQLAL